MDLKYENELIKFDAEFAFEECKKRAESRDLEFDYVVQKFISEFTKLAKKNNLLEE